MPNDKPDAITGGKVCLWASELRVSFPYSKARYDFLRKLSGTSFDKNAREWRVPLPSARKLLSASLFSPEKIRYEFDRAAFDSALHDFESRLAASREKVKSNPFSVPEESLSLLELDVVLRLSPHNDSVRATPRFRSRAKKILQSTPGVHYLRPEKSFFFPVTRLHDFLRTLRDRKLSFAVQEELGERLKRSASLRELIIKERYEANADELRECLLVPFLDENRDGTFRLCSWTTEQLGSCLPELKGFSEKKSRAASMTEDQLLALIHSAGKKGLHIWMTRAVRMQVEGIRSRLKKIPSGPRSPLPDMYVALMELHAVWTTWHDGMGGLLANEDFLASLSEVQKQPLDQGEALAYADRDNTVFIRFRHSLLLAAYESLSEMLGDAAPPATESFKVLLDDLSVRKKRLDDRNYYQSLRDAGPGLANTGLERRMYPHQRVAVKWLIEHECGILGDDMGLGKTLSVLAAFEELKSRGEVDFILVACPNSLVKNWVRETQQWTPALTLHPLSPVKKEREAAFSSLEAGSLRCDGLVLNYESIRLESVCPHVRALCEGRKVLLCLDESQRVKNSQSKTFKALNSVAPLCPRRILLSGTPVPRDIADIWAQMLIIDRGQRFGTRFYDWLPKVAELGNKWSDFAVKRFIPEEVQETVVRVQEVLLRRKKEDVVRLPPKIFSFRDVELDGDQKKRYDEIREELMLRVTKVDGDEYLRSIENLLEEYLRAVQVASNPRLIDPQWKGEPAKFLELDNLVNEIVKEQGDKMVVWTNYRRNVEELVERYKEYGARAFTGDVPQKERAELIGQFQDLQEGTPKVLVAIPAAGGVGITLTAAQTAVYIDRTWNAEHWLQSIDRIHRIGQTGAVNVIVLNACKVDDLIGFNLRRKEKNQEALLRGQAADQTALYPSRQELMEAVV